jgi:hypothetical protein
VADLLDVICIRMLALLEREGVIEDRLAEIERNRPHTWPE